MSVFLYSDINSQPYLIVIQDVRAILILNDVGGFETDGLMAYTHKYK